MSVSLGGVVVGVLYETLAQRRGVGNATCISFVLLLLLTRWDACMHASIELVTWEKRGEIIPETAAARQNGAQRLFAPIANFE